VKALRPEGVARGNLKAVTAPSVNAVPAKAKVYAICWD
jgi:hypothetical protein